MKFLISPSFWIAVFGLVAIESTLAQIKSQSEHIKSIKVGKYVGYSVHESDGVYTYGTADYTMEVTELLPEKGLPQKHHVIMIKEDNAANPSMFVPDNMAFPVLHIRGGYEGNKAMQEKYGYIPFRQKNGVNFLFLDGIMYKVSIDNGEITFWNAFVHEDIANNKSKEADGEKKKMSLKERMANAKKLLTDPGSMSWDGGSKKLIETQGGEKAYEYLKNAIAEKEKVYPEWEKSTEGAAYLKDIEVKSELIFGAINAARMVTFANKTGKDIFVYIGNSTSAGRLEAGASANYMCGLEYFYDFDGKRWYYPNQVKRITSGGNSTLCGKTLDVK